MLRPLIDVADMTEVQDDAARAFVAIYAEIDSHLDQIGARLDALEASGGARLADEAMLDLSERLSRLLNATNDDAERAAIVQVAFNALPSPA